MYYQTPRISTPKMPQGVKWLLIANVAVFVLQLLPVVGNAVMQWGALKPALTFEHIQLWRIVSYMFLHSPDQLFHILFNMLALFWFGAELEDIWGTKKFLIFYIVCGVGAGIFSLLYLFISPLTPIVGASGAVLGVLTAYAFYYPTRQVLLFFIFPIKIRTIVIGYAIMSILFSFRGDGVAHLAHLGGIAVAYLYMKHFPHIGAWIEKRLQSLQVKRARATQAKEAKLKKNMEWVIDPILDKISKFGMASLTPDELALLKRAAKDHRDLLLKKNVVPFV